jgi:hypothetical protein
MILLATNSLLAAPDQINLQTNIQIGLGSEDFILGLVSSVVEDSKGNIYVADVGQEIVLKFSSKGAFLGELGQPGSGPGTIMPRFCIAMNSADEIYLAGIGGRVEVVDLNWEYKRSYIRANPGSPARSIALFPDGRFAVAAAGLATGTTVDVYDADGKHLQSISASFTFNKGFSRNIERTYIGAYAAIDSTGSAFVTQLCPYLVRRFSPALTLVDSTIEGGEQFVEMPQEPEIRGDSVTYRNKRWTTGVAILETGLIVVSSVEVEAVDKGESLICVYSGDLEFIGSVSVPAICRIVGIGAEGRAYLFTVSEAGQILTQVSLVIGGP